MDPAPPDPERSTAAAPPDDAFPLTAQIDLPISPEAAYLSRRAVADVLSGWRLNDQDLRGDALLVASELVTNAVRHGGRLVRLDLELQPETLRIAVSDGSSVLPRPREADDHDREMGRGLLILGELSSSWGVENGPDGGKQVWAALPVTDRPES